MIAVGIIVIQMTRHHVEALYPILLIVRVILLATILWLFFDSRDPLFLSRACVVALSMVFTTRGPIVD